MGNTIPIRVTTEVMGESVDTTYRLTLNISGVTTYQQTFRCRDYKRPIWFGPVRENAAWPLPSRRVNSERVTLLLMFADALNNLVLDEWQITAKAKRSLILRNRGISHIGRDEWNLDQLQVHLRRNYTPEERLAAAAHAVRRFLDSVLLPTQEITQSRPSN
jgi:hypothetical protein